MPVRASFALGFAQLVAGGALAVMAWHLPQAEDVQQQFQQAEQVSRQAAQRVQRGELDRHAAQVRQVAWEQERLVHLSDSVNAIAVGMKAQAARWDPAPVTQLSQGLGAAADYLDKQLIPAAEEAAVHLEKTSKLLHTDSLRVAELLRSAQLDLNGVAQVHEALGKFAMGTEALAKVLEMPHLGKVREGLQGLENSLSVGGQQVENLSSYTYPVVYFEGWKPIRDSRQFWPSGNEIAAGMYKAAAGVKAADRELETLGGELPRVRQALDSSRKILERSQETLATILKQRYLIEPLMRSLPETAARLADDLPKLSQQLSAVLRDTLHLKETALGLRYAQLQLEQSCADWPQIRKMMLDTAAALSDYQLQMQRLAAEAPHRSDRAGQAVETPLGSTLEQIADIQAVQGQTTSHWLRISRWILWILAGLTGLLGISQLTPRR